MKRIVDPSAREGVLARDGFCLYGWYYQDPCEYGLEVHHLIKRSQGGHDVPENMIVLCHKHHMLVEDHTIKFDELKTIMDFLHG